jgi:hypothetical protein
MDVVLIRGIWANGKNYPDWSIMLIVITMLLVRHARVDIVSPRKTVQFRI